MKKLWLWLKKKLFGNCPKCGIRRSRKNFIIGDFCPNRSCDWIHEREEVEKDLGENVLTQLLKDAGKIVR